MIQIRNGRGYIVKCCFDRISEIMKMFDDNSVGNSINTHTMIDLMTRIGIITNPQIREDTMYCLNMITKRKIEYSDVLYCDKFNCINITTQDILDHTGYKGLYEISNEIDENPNMSAMECYVSYIKEYFEKCKQVSVDFQDVMNRLENIKF